MNKLLLILSLSFILAGEMEVDGDLNVSGDIQSPTIEQLQAQIAALQQGADNKLETRVYEFSNGVYEQVYQNFSLSEITNNELSDDNFAIIDIFGYSEDSYLNGNCYLHIKKEFNGEDINRSFVNFQETALNIIHIEWKESIVYEPTINHSIKAVGGDFIGTLKFAVTAQFPN